MELDKLRKSILQTLAFWDIFDYPLTKEELFRYLLIYGYPDLSRRGGIPPHGGGGYSYVDFFNHLGQFEQLHQFEHKDGFYFLPGRQNIVDSRQLKVKLVEQKMKIAKRGIKKLAKVPFVRGVFVCNTLSIGVPDEDSDIDVFIVVHKGRIWLARFLATLSLSLFRLRRTKTKIKNKICLSFYVTDDNLNLEKIAIKDDVYLIYWLNNLIPIYDPDKLHESVMRANQWVKKYLPNGLQGFEVSEKLKEKNKKISEFMKIFFEKMWSSSYGDLIEKQAKGIQQAKMKMNLRSTQNVGGTQVVITDSMMKFHENDRREEYRDEWLAKCEKISNSPNF